MSWTMQVLSDGEWRAVRPTGSEEPYRFPTKEQASYMLRICYPDQLRAARLGDEPVVCIKEDQGEPNIDYPTPRERLAEGERE